MRTKTLLATFALSAGIPFGIHAADVQVTSDISTDTEWTSDNTYILTKPIFVKDGATLTINAGTLIRGEKEVSTDPGALVISRGSKIRAMGTREQPIVFTDMLDDHFVGPNPQPGSAPYSTPNNGISRQWGGLLLLGSTYLGTDVGGSENPSPAAELDLQIEGLEPFGDLSRYGGGNDDDDSGELHYVSIRYGGFVLGTDNEINGLTMGGVGRGTTINHVEVFQNKDDSFEWFGGTVNTKYLVSWSNADDAFDWDQGFRGKGQFWLAVQGPLSSQDDKSDKVGELDGADGDSSIPGAIPTVYNATFIGLGKDTGNQKNTALHFRDGTGGRFYNSLIMDFSGAPALIEGDPTNDKYEAADNIGSAYVMDEYYTHIGGGDKLEILNSAFFAFAFPEVPSIEEGSGTASDWGASSGDADKPHFGYSLGSQYLGVELPLTYLRSETPVTISAVDYYPVEILVPNLPASSPYLTGGKATPDDGFFTPVDFHGAFNDNINWASWTVAAKLGMIATEEGVSEGDYEGGTDPVLEAFPGATPLDGVPGWYESSWFGFFSGEFFPWIFHDQHEFLYVSGDSSSLFLWSTSTGWMFTSSELYPYLYNFDASTWWFYDFGSSNPRWFYDLTAESWNSIP